MKYLNTYRLYESNINFKVIEEGSLFRIRMFDGDVELGYSLVTIKDNVFSKWDLYDEDIEESIPDTKCLYIIGISMSNRKSGYGSKLVKYVEDFAKEKECEYVTLGSISDAIGFWKKKGYSVYGFTGAYCMYKKIF